MSVIKRLIQFCPLRNFSHFRINWIQLFVQKADKNSVFIIFVFKFNSMLLSCYKFIHWVYEIKNTGNIVWYIWSFCSNLSLPTKYTKLDRNSHKKMQIYHGFFMIYHINTQHLTVWCLIVFIFYIFFFNACRLGLCCLSTIL